MARELKNYNWGKKEKKEKVVYDWEAWTNGSTWKLVESKDYEVKTSTFRILLYKKAKELNMRVRTKIQDDSVIFQFYFKKEKVDSAT